MELSSGVAVKIDAGNGQAMHTKQAKPDEPPTLDDVDEEEDGGEIEERQKMPGNSKAIDSIE